MFAIRYSASMIVLVSTFVLGCGSGQPDSFSGKFASVEKVQNQQSFVSTLDGEVISRFAAADSTGESVDRDSAESKAESKQPTVKRQIIYSSVLSLVVDDYQAFEVALPGIVESFGGFISNSETNRRVRARQSGSWTLRVPADNYSVLLSRVTKLGFAESLREDAKDVTDEFVDVQARLRNNTRLEERILKMLDERNGKLSDVIEIERELSRVREESERMEGRLRLLADQASLATIRLSVREEKEFVPPVAPSFADEVSTAWEQSITSLMDFVKGVAILLASLVPWLVAFAIPFAIGLFVWRTQKRSGQNS